MRSYALIFIFALVFTVSVYPSTHGQQTTDNYSKLKALIKVVLDTLVDKLDEMIETRRNSSDVIGKIVGKGYEFFSQSTTMNKLANLNRAMYDRFVDLTVNRFGISDTDKVEIKEKVFGKLKESTKPGEWVEHKMLFNPVSDPSNTKYIAIYGAVRDNLNFDLVILEVKAAFSLAKNLLIIQNKLTGKITLEPEKLETERIPPEVKKDEIQVVLKFFEATALKILNARI